MTRAVAYLGAGRVEPSEVDAIVPGAGEVRVRVAYCGLCGTDLHIIQGHMDSRVQRPLVFGHEMSGEIESISDGVTGWAIGDRVTVMPLVWDGECAACHDGHQHVCQNLDFIGIDSPGALQELWNVPAHTLVRLPPSLDLRTGALVEPTAVAVHDVRRSGLQTGDHAVVFGGGPIGTLIACVARDAGAHVLLVEIDECRRQLVESFGFETVDASLPDFEDAVLLWTGGNGADVVFEVSGAASAVRLTTKVAKVHGTIVVVAIHAAPREVDLQQVFWKELTLVGARVYQRSDFERVVELLAHDVIPADRLISGVVPLEGTQSALENLAGGTAMKMLVDVAGRGAMNALFDLTGRTAVVTGARRGLGRSMAIALVSSGADIIGVSATLTDDDGVGAEVRALGRSFTAHAVDFDERDAVIALGRELAVAAPDILVNNAGTISRAPAAEHPLDQWDRVLNVNLSSQFALTQLVARPMLERGSGKIIFTASLLSFQGGINVPGYTAAKSGLIGLTRALANEWAGRGVNVNAIAPGYMDTDNTAALRADPRRNAAILERIPAGRWGTGDDVAGATVFLASSASDYVSGAILAVDGGWLGR